MFIFNPYFISLLYSYVLYKLKIKYTLSFLYSSNWTVCLFLIEKADLNTHNPNPIYHKIQLHPKEAWPRKPGAETLQIFPRTWNQHLWFSSKTFWFDFQKMSVLLDHICEEEKLSWGLKRLVGSVFYCTGYWDRGREMSEVLGLLAWCRHTLVQGKSRGNQRHSRARMLSTLVQLGNTECTSHRLEQLRKETQRSIRCFSDICILP